MLFSFHPLLQAPNNVSLLELDSSPICLAYIMQNSSRCVTPSFGFIKVVQIGQILELWWECLATRDPEK